ncbi:MAG: hypothetical protein E6I22_09015, partial [Chloroflexi bacterium]
MASTITEREPGVDLDARRREIVARAEAAGLRLVRFLYCDNDGIIRGKSTGMAGFRDRLQTGIGLTLAMQAFTMLDHLASVEGMGPVGEIRLVPDPATFEIAPYAPHTGVVLVDMMTLDGKPYAADGRAFLTRMIARAAERDLELVAAFEPEWSLARKEGDTFVPIDDSGCFTSYGMNVAAAVIDEIVAALDAQGMTVEQYYAELGWGQQELSIRHAPALEAADHHILYRETVRGVALKRALCLIRPQALGRPGGQRLSHSLLGLEPGADRQPVLRPGGAVWALGAGHPVHGRDPGAPAWPGGADLRLRQLVSPAPAADVGIRIPDLGAGQSRGRAPGRLDILGTRGRVHQRRAQVLGLERQSLHRPRRRDRGRPRRDRTQAEAAPTGGGGPAHHGRGRPQGDRGRPPAHQPRGSPGQPETRQGADR